MMQCEVQVFKGWFFLPEDPDNRVPGILNWDPAEGARLELIGGFSTSQNIVDGFCDGILNEVRTGTIFGLVGSKKVSIWDAQRNGYSASIGGLVKQERWTSMQVCVGEHIADPRNAHFSKITMMIDDLYYLVDDRRFLPPEWFRIEQVERPGELLEDGTLLLPYVLPVIGGRRADVCEATTELVSYSVSTTVTHPWISDATEVMPDLKLDFMMQRRKGGIVIELLAEAYFNIEVLNSKTATIIELIDYTSPILDLVHLASFSRPRVASMWLRDDKGGDNLYLLSKFGEVAKPMETHDPRTVVFTLSDVCLDSFFKKRERLTNRNQSSYVWSVVIGLCGYAPRHVEEHVSQSVAAAEGFHTWCLDNSGRIDLKDRLCELYSLLPERVKDKLNFDVEAWSEEAKNARHHVAHGGRERGDVFVDALRFNAIAESVHLVTYLVLLREIDVPVKKICDALNNHPRISSIVKNCGNIFACQK